MHHHLLLVTTAALGLSLVPSLDVARAQQASRPYALPIGEVGRASPTDGTFGIDVGPDGHLYVASPLRNEILVLDRESGEILRRIGAESGVDGPDDVEVADDGAVYWTSPVAGTVGVRMPDGTARTQFVAAGLNPITIKEDGRIFVAAAFTQAGLFEIDPQLLAAPRVILPDIVGLNGFDFGRDGWLYSPSTATGQVVRIDVDASPPRVETVATGLEFPGAVAFDAQDRLYVTDAGKGQVFRVDRRTGALTKLLDIEGTLDNIALADDGRLYATALGDAQVLTLERSGRVRSLTRPGLFAPCGLAVDGAGAVWVADLFSLRRMSPHWPAPLSSFYALLGIEATVDRAMTIDVQDGELLVTTLNNGGVVQRIDPENGDVLGAQLDFYGPSNGVYHDDDIAIAQVFSGDVVRGSDRSVLIENLVVPLGLASRGKELFVGDWGTGMIWSVLGDAAPRMLASGLRQPKGLAVSGDWLFVVEAGADRVAAIHLPTGSVHGLIALDLDDPLPKVGAPPYGLPGGIAVDATRGRLYVSSDRTNQVLAYRLLMPPPPRR